MPLENTNTILFALIWIFGFSDLSKYERGYIQNVWIGIELGYAPNH